MTLNLQRKSLKWYKKFSFPTLDVSVWNLYRDCVNLKERKTFRSPTFAQRWWDEIWQKYCRDNFVKIITKSLDENPLGPTARHFPSIRIDSSDQKCAARKCVGSKNDDEKVAIYCKIWDIIMCLPPFWNISYKIILLNNFIKHCYYKTEVANWRPLPPLS